MGKVESMSHLANHDTESLAIVWRDLLSCTFSILDRMACLSKAQDRQTGRYYHDTLTVHLNTEQIDRSMRLAHQLLWNDWLMGSLEQQRSDLLLHLSHFPSDVNTLLVQWIRLQPFLGYIPDSAVEPERKWFIENLQRLLKMLQKQDALQMPNADAGGQSSLVLVQVIHQIQERYREPNLSLVAVSTRLKVSARHVGRKFRAATGRSFRQYLRNVRIRKASELLLHSDDEVKIIAGLTGYTYSSHFGKDFRLVTGCTPSQFRAKNGEMRARTGAMAASPVGAHEEELACR
jgi:AraC-like DNA-binding protein